MDTYAAIIFISICLSSYLTGSIPSGLLLTKKFAEKDIRQYGSGNIGATNVNRIAGRKLGLATLIADTGKGALPVLAVKLLFRHDDFSSYELLISATALATFSGHLFPCFLRFRGGKGVSTAAGSLFVISPAGVSVAFLVFLAGAFITRRISVGSLCAASSLPLIIWWMTHSPIFSICAGIMAVFIIIKHIDNIRRLISGNEPRFYLKP